jgi:rSAM/selenodomain-associated transferase 2
MKQVSIVIPTFNEEKSLPEVFANLRKLDPPPLEIIVADGASKDNTPDIVTEHGHQLIRVIGRGRAIQMNEGALTANGEILVFLHADTIVPHDLVKIVNDTLSNPRISLGAFICLMKGKTGTNWFISFNNYIKTYLAAFCYNPFRFIWRGFRFLFGDQVMFCRAEDFKKVGGFDSNLPIMEDADLCKKMNNIGCIKQIRRVVYSSDRRVENLGLLKAYFIYSSIAILWYFGVSPYWLKSKYEDIR